MSLLERTHPYKPLKAQLTLLVLATCRWEKPSWRVWGLLGRRGLPGRSEVCSQPAAPLSSGWARGSPPRCVRSPCWHWRVPGTGVASTTTHLWNLPMASLASCSPEPPGTVTALQAFTGSVRLQGWSPCQGNPWSCLEAPVQRWGGSPPDGNRDGVSQFLHQNINPTT